MTVGVEGFSTKPRREREVEKSVLFGRSSSKRFSLFRLFHSEIIRYFRNVRVFSEHYDMIKKMFNSFILIFCISR